MDTHRREFWITYQPDRRRPLLVMGPKGTCKRLGLPFAPLSRRTADAEAVKPDPELDDAIETATDRTRKAQTDVADTIGPDQVPPPAATDRVVHRAEDLHDLTEQAVDEEGPPLGG